MNVYFHHPGMSKLQECSAAMHPPNSPVALCVTKASPSITASGSLSESTALPVASTSHHSTVSSPFQNFETLSSTYPGTSGKACQNTQEQIEILMQVHPDVPLTQLKVLLDASRGNSEAVSDLLLGGLTLLRLCSFFRSNSLDSCDVRKLLIDDYKEDDYESLAGEAIAFTKAVSSAHMLSFVL